MSLFRLAAVCGAALATTGCASTYSNVLSGSSLGAQEYRPAVLVNPGHDEKYAQVLGVCRQAAVNRQLTSAQEAQLRGITGVASGALSGAAQGMQFGSLFKDAGLGTSVNRSAGIGLATGMLASLGSSFASGAEGAAESTKRVLLGCLRAADPQQAFYKVLE